MIHHQVARLFPDLGVDEYAGLKSDIAAHGLKLPILVWQGQLIDGRHRLRACREAGVEPRFEEVDGPEEGLPALVWSLNGARRSLTPTQKAAVAALMSRESRRGRHAPFGAFSQPQAAEVVGASRRHVQRAAEVMKEDPALFNKIKDGEITVSAALREIGERENPPTKAQAYEETLSRALQAAERCSDLARDVSWWWKPDPPRESPALEDLKGRLRGVCATLGVGAAGAGYDEGWRCGAEFTYYKGWNQGYSAAKVDGVQASPITPPGQWVDQNLATLIRLCHPDKHPSNTAAASVVQWLVERQRLIRDPGPPSFEREDSYEHTPRKTLNIR